MTDRFMYELPLWIRTQPVLDRLGDDLSDMTNLQHDKLPPRAEGYDSIRSPEANLMDTMAHLQTLPVQSKPVAFTSQSA